MTLKRKFQALASTVMDCDYESDHLLDMIRRHAGPGAAILDVGCGYGRNLALLTGAGFSDVTGVEKNLHIVDEVRRQGCACMGLEEFEKSDRTYDVILMSHVIEHFEPQGLLGFIDSYLDRLAPGGYLVIATPLLGDCFYDDFDHVKPYLPTGILNVFGKGHAQVQFYSKNNLELLDLWFRRGFHKFAYFKSAYIKTPMTIPVRMLNMLSAVVFRLSFGMIGKVDGWVGIFRKC